MDRYSRERLEELFRNGGPIPQHFVSAAFDSNDVGAQDLARVIVQEAFHRVKPKMELTWSGECLMRYYLQRIKAGTPESDEAIGPYQGAYGLTAVFRNAWKNRPETAGLVKEIVERVTRMFHEEDQTVQDCLEMGFLEHALESPELRALFEHWEKDAVTREAYRRSIAWGKGHESA